MATILEYARLAEAVYKDTPNVGDWTRVNFKPAVSNILGKIFWEGGCLQAAAYAKGADVVFAFKGTDVFADGIADVKLGVGMNTAQFNHAGKFVESTNIRPNSTVSICGHSLGGAIAQVIGNRQRLRFVTFNAPGVAIMSRNIDQMAFATFVGTTGLRSVFSIVSAFRHPGQFLEDVGSAFYFVKGVNFRLGKDVFGNIGVHYGKVIKIPYQGGAMDLKAKHQIATVIAAIQGSKFANLHLDDVLTGPS